MLDLSCWFYICFYFILFCFLNLESVENHSFPDFLNWDEKLCLTDSIVEQFQFLRLKPDDQFEMPATWVSEEMSRSGVFGKRDHLVILCLREGGSSLLSCRLCTSANDSDVISNSFLKSEIFEILYSIIYYTPKTFPMCFFYYNDVS